PLARQAEEAARHEIHERPVDKVRLDDRREAAEEHRPGEPGGTRGLHPERSPENDDRRLDVPFRPRRFPEPAHDTGVEIPARGPAGPRVVETPPRPWGGGPGSPPSPRGCRG